MKKFFCLLLLLAATRLLAVTPVPFTESMGFSFKIDGTGAASINVHDETGTQYVLAYSSGTTIESGPGLAWMIPGKSYTLEFWGLGPPNYTMSFTAPTGYSVYVNGVATNLVSQSPGTGWHLEYYTIELRPSAGEAGGMWGQFSGIALGKAISWGVGLGDLRTGRSAGGIQFKALDLANNPASRARLYYASPPANVGQIAVVKDGPSNQTLRQIATPIGFTDLVDVTGGYEIRCYSWSQVSSWNGTLYVFTGSPWKTIKVESPAANQLKITETEGSVVRVSNLVGTGSTTETGGTITYNGSNTQHTFTSGGTLTLSSAHSGASWLVVGGGGGGGTSGGGGGAGSMEYLTGQSLSAGTYSVVVGAGGASDTAGSNSTFNSTTGYGGGRGASNSAPPGGGGSSGGGCVNNNTGGPPQSGSGSNIHWGGNGDNGGYGWRGGGGGGAGQNGHGVGEGANTGYGGDGLANSISGSSVIYGGGGAGSSNSGPGLPGGSGGGGTGVQNGVGGNGAANKGAGGAAGDGAAGGSGGSGIVIVSYPTPTMIWTLQEGDATNCIRTTIHTSTPGSGQRDDVVTVYTTTGTYAAPTNTLVAKTKFHYVNQAWGEELDSVIADPDASNPSERTTTYTYHTTSSAYGNYRNVKSVTQPTGNWTVFEYYDDWDRRGQLKYEYHPYLDAPSTATSYSATTGRVVYLEYNSADWTGRYSRPTLREERINNVVTGKTTWSHGDITGSGEPRAYATVNSYRDGSTYQTDYVESYRADADPDFAGQPYVAKGANLAQSSGSVSRGTFNTSTKAFVVSSTGDHWRLLKFNGSTSSTGATAVTSFDGQGCASVYLIPNQSTLEVTVRIAQGYIYRTETWVFTGSGGTNGFHLMTAEDFDYDGTGHLTQRWASTGTGALTNYTYTNGRLTSTLGADGTENQLTYDLIGRVATSIKKGAAASSPFAAQSDITTTYTYDGAGRAVQTVSAGGSLSQTTTSTYDLAGRMTQTVAPGSYTTSFAYSSGGKIVTATLPGGATKITEAFLDGQAKSSTGTAVVAGFSTVTVNATTGNITRQANYGTSTSTALVKITADWLGRAVTEVKPGYNGSDVTRSWTYNNSGQLVKISQPGVADTLYVYDSLGQVVREGLDVNANGALDAASSDRITEHAWTFFNSSGWWRRETTGTYATLNDGTLTQTGKVEQQISGLATNRVSFTKSYDIFGNVTTQATDLDRSGKKVTTTTDAPDSTTDAVQIAYNGLLMSSRDTANITMTYGYDALGRPTTSTDPRTGTTTTAFVTGTSQVLSVTDPASVAQATYTYDSAGRTTSVTNALSKVSRYEYTARNEKLREWGDTTYPVEYGYDTWGRQTTMKTFRAGTGFTGSTWPTSTAGTADTTTWAFQESTGLLTSKTDAAGKAVAYTYTQAGQIATRAWARFVTGTTPVTTTYAYSSTTGELTSATYNDGTPTTTYTYDRRGLTATVVDITGQRYFERCECGKVLYEQLDSNLSLTPFYERRLLTYKIDATTTGALGRTRGYSLTKSGTTEIDVNYGFDASNRYNSIGLAGTSISFDYAYVTNSNLIASIADAGSGWTQTRTYLSNRDLLDVIETKVSTTSKAKFDHAHDSLGRRTSVNKTGELFSRYGNGTQGLDTAFGYDDRSQLTSEETKLGGSSAVLTGRDDSYVFDNLGSRTAATHNGTTFNYTTNALNQYTQRTVPGVFDVAGAAASSATVTVNSSSTGVTRHGDYFFKGQSMSNNPTAAYDTLSVSDGTTTTSLKAFTAGTPEAYAHDLDGNLTSDGRWDYTYDAENRLVSMQTHTALTPSPVPNADARRLEFTYDYQHRRVRKTVRAGWNGTVYTTVVADTKFLYDGWNLLAEYDVGSGGALTASRGYVWGVDWSGTLQGAGGVGGLLLVRDVATGANHQPVYDGSGNLLGLLDRSTGAWTAQYEYDAFGNTVRATGSFASANPFGHATKYTDLETGLIYYGRRYYDPRTGRWLSRDPKEELAGLHLYAFVRNNPVNKWDYLGMNEGVTTMATLTVTATSLAGFGFGGFGGYAAGRSILMGGGDASVADSHEGENSDDVVQLEKFVVTADRVKEPSVPNIPRPDPIDPDSQDNAEVPNRTEELNKCYGAARTAHSADSARLGQIGEARIESFFGSISAQRSAARAAFGEAAARTVRDSMIGVGVGTLVGAGASYQWARAAATGRSMYATARNWQQVSAIATEVASYQTTANYVRLGFGTTAGVAYNVWNSDDAAGAVSGSIGELSDAMLETRFGQAGVAIGITQNALEYMSNSGLSDQQVAGVVAGIRGEVNQTQQTLDSRLQSAISACDEKFK